MSPAYWFAHAALAATLAKAAKEIGNDYQAHLFSEAAVWYTAQGIASLAVSAAQKTDLVLD